VGLKVDIHDSEIVVEKVLSGESDFGFITRDIEHPQLSKIEFCHENYVLIAKAGRETLKGSLMDWQFIEHPDFASLFHVWFKAQFPRKRIYSVKKLHLSGSSNRIAAALSMVSGGLGVTVLPEHCAEDLIKDKKIKILKGLRPAVGTINIIFRKDGTLPKRVSTVINTFLGFYNKSL
jgi:LysR family transcriptional regulator, transcriptional activator of the cysJI operon